MTRACDRSHKRCMHMSSNDDPRGNAQTSVLSVDLLLEGQDVSLSHWYVTVLRRSETNASTMFHLFGAEF